MDTTRKPRPDDPSSAPESGTVRDDTSGNQTANPQERPAPLPSSQRQEEKKDAPDTAGEER